MIQIQGREQFRNAAARIRKERMSVRRYERGAYMVRNTVKGHDYLVTFTRRGGNVFGACTCEAGMPTRRNARPLICKHLLSAVLVHNAINAMRRAASVPTAPLPEFDDSDDGDLDAANW